MSVSGGFNLQTASTVRIACDLKDADTGDLMYDGFWIEARRNLSNGERRQLIEAATEIDQRVETLIAENKQSTDAYIEALQAAEGDAEKQTTLTQAQTVHALRYVDEITAIGIERFTLVAPHIHRWNLITIGADGDIAAVPSPRDDVAAALDAITPDIAGWLLNATLMAYRRGFAIGSRTSGARQEPTPEPSAESPKTSGSRSRRSRPTSSSPSPSTFEA